MIVPVPTASPAVHPVLQTPGLAELFATLPGARLVGGSVRDALASLPVADIDLATPDPPDRVLAALERAGIRAIPTGLAHGTVTAVIAHRPFEITTLRRDVETFGRHATVAWTEDWQQDAARRDFTINAMSMDRDGTVHDYFGGETDLAAGRIRFVGDPARRVAEDYLRILRYFRFLARYGSGDPDAPAVAAIREGVPGLAALSAERVWSELKRILAIPDPRATLRLMAETDVLAAVLPEAGADLPPGLPADPLLRLAALLAAPAPELASRLRFSTAEAERVAALHGGPAPTPGEDDAALRRALADISADILIGRTWLAGQGPEWSALRARLAAMPRPVFPLKGRDALALGAAPGPPVGAALRRVRDWWLAGGCVADVQACREQLRRELRAAP